MVLYKLKNSYELKEKNTFIKVYSYLFGKEAIKVNKLYKKFLNFIKFQTQIKTYNNNQYQIKKTVNKLNTITDYIVTRIN